MLRSAARMIGYRVSALDGEIGRCEDFLFDESQWRVRYLIVKTTAWLSGRCILVSPLELRKADWTSRRLVLEGSRECLRNRTSAGSYAAERASEPDSSESGAGSGPRQMLRAIKPLLGYGLQAEDRSVGLVEDLLVDDDTWSLPYLVVDSENWLEGRKMLVPGLWVSEIDRQLERAKVARPSSEIETSPNFDPTAPARSVKEFESGAWREPAAQSEITGPARLLPWHWVQSETWRTHGLKAALARIIQG